MGRDTMTVVCWTNPVSQRQDGMWAETGRTQPTKLHITRDGVQTVCGCRSAGVGAQTGCVS